MPKRYLYAFAADGIGADLMDTHILSVHFMIGMRLINRHLIGVNPIDVSLISGNLMDVQLEAWM